MNGMKECLRTVSKLYIRHYKYVPEKSTLNKTLHLFACHNQAYQYTGGGGEEARKGTDS